MADTQILSFHKNIALWFTVFSLPCTALLLAVAFPRLNIITQELFQPCML